MDVDCVTIGFVGCGGIASVHLDRLLARNDVRVVGCCDANPERAEQFAAKSGATVYKDPVSLYDGAKPRAVYVAVPPDAHGSIETEAAARGMHLFIEKPIALDMKTARKIAAGIRDAQVQSSVGYCFRYLDSIQIANQCLKGKAISLAAGMCHGGLPEAPWWRQRARSGGQLIEQTTHIVDLMLYLCGPVSEVHAASSRGCLSQIKDYDIDDSSVLSMRLKTGAVACITSTCVLSHPGQTALTIVTPEMTLFFNGNVVSIREDHKVVEHHNASDMYALENAAFIKAVQQGKRLGIRSTYADAMKTLRVTLAATESMDTGMPVTL